MCRSCSVSGMLVREHVGRQQPLEEVVVAAVAVASREAEHAGDGVRLEHRANGVRRDAEPVGRRPALALEVERRQRALGADPLEHAPGHLGVLGEEAGRVPAQGPAEPREARSSGRARVPCCTPRRSRGARRADRTRQGRSRPRARAARGRGFDRRPRADRTGSSRDRRKTSSTASGPPSSERAGASAWRATRKRRAASAVTLTAGDASGSRPSGTAQRHRLATEPYSLS